MNQKIGVLDSGIGGFTVLNEIINILPAEDYVYYADGKNNPYGEKTTEEIYEIVNIIVRRLVYKENCKMIVIACNTATTRCMKKLKQEYPEVLFVGTVPAIKTACDYHFLHTLVLATPSTVDSERTKELIRDNKREDQEIILISCNGLANAIEKGNQCQVYEILQNVRDEVLDKNIDSIVLKITPKTPKIKVHNEMFFYQLIKHLFQERRKTLVNNLQAYFPTKEETILFLNQRNITCEKRIEQLSLDEIIEICNHLC